MSCTVEVRLKPGAKEDRVTVSEQGNIDIRVASPPVEGKANASLLRLLSKVILVPRSTLEIIRGKNCRSKVIRVEGLTEELVMERLKMGQGKFR